jgi:hypothetical protein
MSDVENVPLLETVTRPIANVLDMAFGCHHRKLSRVFTINGHSYKVCCDCGETFHYSLESMSVTRRRRLFSALRHLRVQSTRRLLRRMGRS